jgi:hypothetical protein
MQRDRPNHCKGVREKPKIAHLIPRKLAVVDEGEGFPVMGQHAAVFIHGALCAEAPDQALSPFLQLRSSQDWHLFWASVFVLRIRRLTKFSLWFATLE